MRSLFVMRRQVEGMARKVEKLAPPPPPSGPDDITARLKALSDSDLATLSELQSVFRLWALHLKVRIRLRDKGELAEGEALLTPHLQRYADEYGWTVEDALAMPPWEPSEPLPPASDAEVLERLRQLAERAPSSGTGQGHGAADKLARHFGLVLCPPREGSTMSSR